MGEVIEADIITKLDIPVERVLRNAATSELETAVVIGWDKHGELYFHSSVSSGPEVLWLLEQTKRRLLTIDANEGEG